MVIAHNKENIRTLSRFSRKGQQYNDYQLKPNLSFEHMDPTLRLLNGTRC